MQTWNRIKSKKDQNKDLSVPRSEYTSLSQGGKALRLREATVPSPRLFSGWVFGDIEVLECHLTLDNSLVFWTMLQQLRSLQVRTRQRPQCPEELHHSDDPHNTNQAA